MIDQVPNRGFYRRPVDLALAASHIEFLSLITSKVPRKMAVSNQINGRLMKIVNKYFPVSSAEFLEMTILQRAESFSQVLAQVYRMPEAEYII